MPHSDEAVKIQASYPEQSSARLANTRYAAALLAAAGLLAAPPAQAAFFTPGQFDVTPSGAASYTVPIAVPPGTAGMVPSLALAYNSQGGNGLLGVGWSLSGLSAVTRCPKTIIQDGTKGGINYDATDKYCLDGQRLVAISGTYGANNTEYRTEREGFSKIVSYGSNGYGPTWFKVWTKSGQIMEFGNTADSAIEAQGKTAIRIWAANKIADTKGNYLTVTYTEDNPNGQYYPNRIDYTGNAGAGLATYNSVRFVYATKPDITPMYDGGSLIKTTVRLTNVQTWANASGVDAKVKDYSLAYDTSSATLRSRLISLTECDGATPATCLQATTLGWETASNGFQLPTYSNPALPAYLSGGWATWGSGGIKYMYPGDFNGDGKTDYMWNPANGGGWLIAYGTGTGLTLPDYNNPALPAYLNGGWATWGSGGNYTHWGDFNGDGKTDFMWQPANGDGRWLIAYSTGAGFILPDYNNPALPSYLNGGWATWGSGGGYTHLGDFNGDGKTDYMWNPANGYGWLIAYANGSGKQPDTLTTFTTGLGAATAVSYKPLTDTSVYTKESGSVYPYVDLQVPQYVVSSASSSNGIGGNYTSNYTYTGAKSHLTGGGFLGYRQTTSTDAQTGIVSKTTYRQDYPYQGLPLTAEKRTSTNVLLNSVTNTWAFTTNPAWSAQYHVPKLTQSVESSYELTGAIISTVTTGNTYDGYGNPTVITVSTPDGYSKTTTNVYNNDTVNWYLGRLTNATVTSTTP